MHEQDSALACVLRKTGEAEAAASVRMAVSGSAVLADLLGFPSLGM